MRNVELTDEEFHWVAVAIENSLESAKRLGELAKSFNATDDMLDAGLLVNRYTALQEKFPTPDISLRDGKDDGDVTPEA